MHDAGRIDRHHAYGSQGGQRRENGAPPLPAQRGADQQKDKISEKGATRPLGKKHDNREDQQIKDMGDNLADSRRQAAVPDDRRQHEGIEEIAGENALGQLGMDGWLRGIHPEGQEKKTRQHRAACGDEPLRAILGRILDENTAQTQDRFPLKTRPGLFQHPCHQRPGVTGPGSCHVSFSQVLAKNSIRFNTKGAGSDFSRASSPVRPGSIVRNNV